MTTTPALNDDLLQRLTGENPDRVTPADRLRLYGTDPETFVFDSGDAWEAVELLEAAASALEAQSKEIEALRSVLEPTHRYKKRGTEYVLLGIGKMQAEEWVDEKPSGEGGSVDMREVAIYRSVDDGSMWVRPREEFEDGRFEEIARTALKGA